MISAPPSPERRHRRSCRAVWLSGPARRTQRRRGSRGRLRHGPARTARPESIARGVSRGVRRIAGRRRRSRPWRGGRRGLGRNLITAGARRTWTHGSGTCCSEKEAGSEVPTAPTRDWVQILRSVAKHANCSTFCVGGGNGGAPGDDAAGREAAGAAVVCSMMALHAEDGAGKRGGRMARKARRDRA